MNRTPTIATMMLAGLVLTGCGGGQGSAAKSACHGFVKERLRSPSTADFDDNTVREVRDGHWLVGGAVDSENLYGGTVHSGFSCKMTVQNGNWHLDHFDFIDGGELG